nr:catalase-related domain-containing protein [Paenibacillus sp. OV219]
MFVRFSTVTYVEPSYTILDGAASVRQVIDKPNNFGQAGLVWNRYSEQEQAAVIKNLTNDLRAVSERTQLLAICNFYRADAALGHLLADSLNVDISAYVSPSKQP